MECWLYDKNNDVHYSTLRKFDVQLSPELSAIMSMIDDAFKMHNIHYDARRNPGTNHIGIHCHNAAVEITNNDYITLVLSGDGNYNAIEINLLSLNYTTLNDVIKCIKLTNTLNNIKYCRDVPHMLKAYEALEAYKLIT